MNEINRLDIHSPEDGEFEFEFDFDSGWMCEVEGGEGWGWGGGGGRMENGEERRRTNRSVCG